MDLRSKIIFFGATGSIAKNGTFMSTNIIQMIQYSSIRFGSTETYLD